MEEDKILEEQEYEQLFLVAYSVTTNSSSDLWLINNKYTNYMINYNIFF